MDLKALAWRLVEEDGVKFFERYWDYKPQLAVRYAAADSGFTFIIILMALVLLRFKYLKWVRQGIGVVCFLSSIWVMMEYFDGQIAYKRDGGIGGNASMDACLIALTYPFLVYQEDKHYS